MKEFFLSFGVAVVAVFLLDRLLHRVLVPWQAKRWVDKTLRKIERGEKFERRVFETSIVWDSAGFFVRNDKSSERSPCLPWATIAKVTAFKRDLWATDCICLFFETSDQKGLEVDEERNGWIEFVEELPKFLPGCKSSSDWIWTVAVPAFAPNVTEIFLRPQCEPSAGESAC